MTSKTLKHKTVVGTFWSSIERFAVQGIQFLIFILMARILTPEDYGIIAMLTIFLAIAQSLIDSGFSNALIQKIDRTEKDYSTVFFFNIAVGLLLYLLMFVSAGYIADFYNTPLLAPITRVISITLFINSLAVVPRAILTINIDFKTQAKASVAATVLSGIAGIMSAYYGLGAWSIAIYTVSNTFINTALLWILIQWRPTRAFSAESFKRLFSFGSKLMLSGLIDTIYKNLYLLVIGKKFAANNLGYYSRADQFAQFPSSNLTYIIQRATYPVLCTLQNDNERLAPALKKCLRLSAFLIFPLMTGLTVLASPVILTLLNPEWEPAVLILQLLSIAYMWAPIHVLNMQILLVKGYSNLFLKLEIAKKVVGITILVVTLPFGIIPMCAGLIFYYMSSLLINTYYTHRLIGIGIRKQFKELLPALFYSLSMGIVIYILTLFCPTPLLKLIVGTLGGMIYYYLIARSTHSSDLREILCMISNKQKTDETGL